MGLQKQTPVASGGDIFERNSQVNAPSNSGSNSDPRQYLDQFKGAVAARGLVLSADLVADGKVHRCGTATKPKGTDGAYLLFEDGRGGGCQNHTDGRGWEDWQADMGRTFTPEEQTTFQEHVAAARKTREAEESRRRAAAATRAVKMWDAAAPCEEHAYLTQKGIQPHGVRVLDGNLVLPLYTSSGKISTIQTIAPDGSKMFLPGGRKQGCSFMLGTPGEGPLGIAEGFATAASVQEALSHAVAVAFDCGNLLPVAKALKLAYPVSDLVIFADDDLTPGNPGLTKAKEAAAVVGCRVVSPDWGGDRPAGATDFNDLSRVRGKEAIRFIETSVDGEMPSVPEPPSGGSDASENIFEAVKRFSTMHPLEYEKVRAAEAKRLGVRATELDKFVTGARRDRQEELGRSAMFPEVEPWPDRVVLSELLDELRATVHRFIVCDKETAVAVALWVAFTWCINHVQVAALLVITAPEKRCGKSQLLDVVGRLSCRPLVASNISSAAVFRVIEAHCPTLLIDEADSFMKENEELRGVINSGHTRQSAYVIRTVGDDHEPRQFSTWGAKAISGIGHLAGTLMDRAIVLTLRRKLPSEKCSRLRHADPETFKCLASRLARFGADSGPSIGQARPDLPEDLNDRAQDNWEALLAIADHAGGQWPSLARAAALNLSGSEHEAVSTATELLADIQEIFNTKNIKQISTAELLTALISDELRPWGSYSYGKPITSRQLSKRLGEFGIGSKNIRIDVSGNVVLKGYQLDQFKDVFERYLIPLGTPPNLPLPATNEKPCGSKRSGSVAVADSDATNNDQVADRRATRYGPATAKPAPLLKSSGVADSGGVSGEVVGLRINGRRAV